MLFLRLVAQDNSKRIMHFCLRAFARHTITAAVCARMSGDGSVNANVKWPIDAKARGKLLVELTDGAFLRCYGCGRHCGRAQSVHICTSSCALAYWVRKGVPSWGMTWTLMACYVCALVWLVIWICQPRCDVLKSWRVQLVLLARLLWLLLVLRLAVLLSEMQQSYPVLVICLLVH